MDHALSHLDNEVLSIIRRIGRKADERGCPAYLVGGFVRDLILRKKNYDIDVVVVGDAIALARALAESCPGKLTIYEQFGTAAWQMHESWHIDFAASRRERYPHPGALPVVGRGSIKDDLFRRDFTINAMAIKINQDFLGEMVDFFGGREDIKGKKIRILHDQSFIDDPTRILRAVRFEQRLLFRMENTTLQRLKAALKEGAAATVKPQRYFEEFKKFFEEPSPHRPLSRLKQLGGLGFLGNGFKWSPLVPALSRNVEETVHDLKAESSTDPLTPRGEGHDVWCAYMMALLVRTPLDQVKKMVERFNLSRVERARILEGTQSQQILKNLSQAHLRPSQIYRLLKPLSHDTLTFILARASRRAIVKKRINGFRGKYEGVRLNIKGDDLKRLGVPEDKNLGLILNELLDYKIDGTLHSRYDELKKARELYDKDTRRMTQDT